MPPHIEDYYFDPEETSNIVTCNDVQWEKILKKNCFASIEEMFDGYLEGDRRVPPNAGTRSLGTLCDVSIVGVVVDNSHGRQQFRIDFEESTGRPYKGFPVNDLAFRVYLQKAIDTLHSEKNAESSVLQSLLSTERTYLRIGLARPRKMGNYPEACWTQVTGVYTFPDYLDGKTFADLLN